MYKEGLTWAFFVVAVLYKFTKNGCQISNEINNKIDVYKGHHHTNTK